MFESEKDRRLTRKERLAVILAVAASLAVHAAVFVGSGGLRTFTQKEKKRERVMIVRRMRDIAPQDVTPRPEARMQARLVPEAPPAGPAKAGGAPRPPGAPATKAGGPPAPAEAPTEAAEPQLQETPLMPPEQAAPGTGETADNGIAVVTDLAAATFTVSGPQDYRGSGTFWLRKGAPPGRYTVTFLPAAGFGTPPPQSKELVMHGQISFMGRYKKSIEIAVNTNEPGARFKIYRPDGRPLDMTTPGRGLYEDLPPGNYTVVFDAIPGHRTPGSVVRSLVPGAAGLSFTGEYVDEEQTASLGGRGGAPGGVPGGVPGGRGSVPGGSAPARKPEPPPPAGAAGLDRRVQMVVKSYPPTKVEDAFDPIPYPDRVISRSNYQKGWCQVYVVVSTDDRGRVANIEVLRPSAEQRAQYQELVDAVEKAVRGWDYDKVAAEVNIDVRFYVE